MPLQFSKCEADFAARLRIRPNAPQEPPGALAGAAPTGTEGGLCLRQCVVCRGGICWQSRPRPPIDEWLTTLSKTESLNYCRLARKPADRTIGFRFDSA